MPLPIRSHNTPHALLKSPQTQQICWPFYVYRPKLMPPSTRFCTCAHACVKKQSPCHSVSPDPWLTNLDPVSMCKTSLEENHAICSLSCKRTSTSNQSPLRQTSCFNGRHSPAYLLPSRNWPQWPRQHERRLPVFLSKGAVLLRLWQAKSVKHQIPCAAARKPRESNSNAPFASSKSRIFLSTSSQRNSGEGTFSTETFSSGKFSWALRTDSSIAFSNTCWRISAGTKTPLSRAILLAYASSGSSLKRNTCTNVSSATDKDKEESLHRSEVVASSKATASVRLNDPSFIHKFQAKTIYHWQQTAFIMAPSTSNEASQDTDKD